MQDRNAAAVQLRELRAVLARWLRVRARVRSMQGRLAVAQLTLHRDAGGGTDADELGARAQLAAQHAATDALAAELDERIAAIRSACTACEAAAATLIVADARSAPRD